MCKFQTVSEGKMRQFKNKRRWFLYVIVSLCGGTVTGIVYYFLSIIREKRRQI
jgi:Mn2+/Fe2+ NRAMP family transporter